MWSPIRRYATDLLWSNFAHGWPASVGHGATPYTWNIVT